MSDLVENHIVGFPTRRLISFTGTGSVVTCRVDEFQKLMKILSETL